MKLIFSLLLLTTICITSLFSCKKKFDDGPRFSLKSISKRLEGKWQATYQRENGYEYLNNYSINFKPTGSRKNPEGDYHSYTVYTSDGSGVKSSREGNWSVSGDKENLYLQNETYSIDYNDGTAIELGTWRYTDNYRIKRLTNKELWLEIRSTTYNLYLEFEKE